MPPKAKSGAKGPAQSAKPPPPDPEPQTIDEQAKQRFYQTNPLEKRREEVGFAGLTDSERNTYSLSRTLGPLEKGRVALSNKTERDFWKQASKESLPLRRVRRDYDWGKDRSGRHLGSYKPADFDQQCFKQARLAALDVQHQRFLSRRDIARREGREVTTEEIEEEKKTRRAMANLNKELYGRFTGLLAQDPLWDDVIPIPLDEPEDALAQIAYPEDYAEAVSYLRAIMASEECTRRALRLTEHVISMNPAHYTVWLCRFKVLSVLAIPVPEEIEWLNAVSLANLKNYQIWHHRQLLMDYYHPQIESDPEAVKKLARAEAAFMKKMLEADTKNYHVWSYRQYVVRKLGMWNLQELLATQNMIEEDVRNNSAWSHRFYLIFSDPKHATPALGPAAQDEGIPGDILDREIAYAQDKILLAPQNQAAWNYLKGAMTKGGRPLPTLKEFAGHFVTDLGEEGEAVKSSHALEVLADTYKEEGKTEQARLCLRRLWEKWDPVREGYWKWRAGQLDE